MEKEIIYMPPKARMILERYKDCIIRVLSTVSWTMLYQRNISPDNVVNEAKRAAVQELISTSVAAAGKDHVVTTIRQDMEGVHVTAEAIFFTQDKFEEMITDVYIQGLLEGRKDANRNGPMA